MSASSFFASLEDVDYSDISSWPHALKLISSLLVGLAILAAIFFMFYQPKLESIKAAEVQEDNFKIEFEKKQKLAVNLSAYQEQMVEIKDRFDEVLRQLPDESEVPALLTDISVAGLEQGLEFQRFKPSRPEQKNFYVQMPIDIEASGNYHQLAEFISLIANFKRVVTVGDLEISRSKQTKEDDGESVPLNFKAKLYTYHFSENENLENQNDAAVSRIRK